MRRRSLLIAAAWAIGIVEPSFSATFSGFPIDYGTLPEAARAQIPITVTTDQFKARLKDGGTVILDNNETEIGKIDPTKKSLAFLALDVLELKHGARIITNGNSLVILLIS